MKNDYTNLKYLVIEIEDLEPSKLALLSKRGQNAIPLLKQHLSALYEVLEVLDEVWEETYQNEQFDIAFNRYRAAIADKREG